MQSVYEVKNAVDFLNDNLSSIGTLDPLDEDRHKKALSIAMNVYWKRLIEDNPRLLDSRINADYHTILMSYALTLAQTNTENSTIY